jgi:hypothetical protein
VTVLDATRNHVAPQGLFQLPRIESGTETFDFEIPAGLQLALIDIELTDSVPLASAELDGGPARGATGRQSVSVKWSHPVPLGKIAYRIKVYASSTGAPPPVTIGMTEPGVERRLRALVEQDVPIDLAVGGELAKRFHDEILSRGGQIIPLAKSMDGGIISGPTAAVIIGLAVIAAICIVVGMAVLAGVIFIAISKGYNIDDAGYKVAVGEGKSRQEHQMVFKIRQPGT